MISKVYEFILWDNCSNNCSFCWQKKYGHISTNKEKIDALNTVKSFIASDKFEFGSHILVVGGELFDNGSNNIKLEFQKFWSEILNFQIKNKIGLVYINTNLLYNNLEHILFLLSCAEKFNLLHRIKFTTSYDSKGRFLSQDKKELFSKNLKDLMIKFKSLKCVINTILTKHFCETYDYTKSFLKEIKEKFTERTSVNFLPYISFDQTDLPNRADVFKVLLNEDKFNPGFLSLYTSSMALNQIKNVYKIKNNNLIDHSCKLLDCGHPENFIKYTKHNTCFVCDLKRIVSV